MSGITGKRGVALMLLNKTILSRDEIGQKDGFSFFFEKQDVDSYGLKTLAYNTCYLLLMYIK